MSINPPPVPVRPRLTRRTRPPGPGPARAHVRRLRQDGSTYSGIASAAGLAPATVSDLARGRRRSTRGTAAAVLAVTTTGPSRGAAWTPAAPACGCAPCT